MKVPIELYVEQVKDGVEYKGNIAFAGTKFDYTIVFTVPIPKLDELGPPEGPEEVRRLCPISLTRDENGIELTDEEYGLFFHLLIQFVVDFYNNPQTRDNNQGLLGQPKILESFGASLSIGMSSSGESDFTPETCNMLNQSKFGCALVE